MKTFNQHKIRFGLGLFLLYSAFSPFDLRTSALSADSVETKTWNGKWTNKKYGTSGKIVCKASPQGDTWEAKFTGVALGEPFAYGATVKATMKGAKQVLKGVSNVDGATYTWTGYISGGKFVGKYKASNGFRGTFSMRESK
ncbi:MAG: hypothetical protein GXP30_07115 [Verrucomicrobia bacterium]|nr:hypothetical protein [Verrucomicrobiota bacterium]